MSNEKSMKLAKDDVLILRTCDANGCGHGGFQWPKKGKVSAPDWRDDFQCGGGLHGLLWGVGSQSYLKLDSPVWIVFRAKLADVRTGKGELTDRCKAHRGTVVYYGNRDGAILFIAKYAPTNDTWYTLNENYKFSEWKEQS